jgi:hypothetical protein
MRIPITKNQLNLLGKQNEVARQSANDARSAQAIAAIAGEKADAAQAALNGLLNCLVVDFDPKQEGVAVHSFTFGADDAGPFLAVESKPEPKPEPKQEA